MLNSALIITAPLPGLLVPMLRLMVPEPRGIKLWQRIEDVHRRTRALCAFGEQVIPRGMKRHMESEKCKQKRARASMGDVR